MNGLLLSLVISTQSPLNAIDAAAMTDFKGELVPLPVALAAFSKSAGVTMKANVVMSARKVDVGFDRVPMRSAMKALELAVGGTWTFDGKDLILVESEKERADRAKELARRAADRKKSVEFVLGVLNKYAGKSEEELKKLSESAESWSPSFDTKHEEFAERFQLECTLAALQFDEFRSFVVQQIQEGLLTINTFSEGNTQPIIFRSLDRERLLIGVLSATETTVYLHIYETKGESQYDIMLPLAGSTVSSNGDGITVDKSLLGKPMPKEPPMRKGKWNYNERTSYDYLASASLISKVPFVSEAFRETVNGEGIRYFDVWQHTAFMMEAQVKNVDGIAVPIQRDADDLREREIPESVWNLLEKDVAQGTDPSFHSYLEFVKRIPDSVARKLMGPSGVKPVSLVSLEPLDSLPILKLLSEQSSGVMESMFSPVPVKISEMNHRGNWLQNAINHETAFGNGGSYLVRMFFGKDLPELALFLDRRVVTSTTTEVGPNIKVTDTSPEAALSKNATKETQYNFYLGYGINSSVKYSFTLRNP